MASLEDRTRIPFRRDVHDTSRLGYDMSFSSDQGPGPATVETTPPRTVGRPRPRYMPHSGKQSSQENPDCLTAEQTTDLFIRRIEDARNEAQHVYAGTEEVSDALKPTLTIDLGRARIERLPDAVIDLIIADVERLSLSHNFLRYIPSRIAECTQLRYLNIRSNDFKEIPPSIYRMPLLEILDVSKNKITTIPPEIKNVESLRVFSVVHNRLTDLPFELTELPRLKVLKVAENPFKKSIKRVIHEKEVEVAYSEMLENEKDTALTAEILTHLKKMKPATTPAPLLDNTELNEGVIEPARPTRRALSGRFPVIPATTLHSTSSQDSTVEGQEGTPSQAKAPSLPIKSHLRGFSGQMNQTNGSKRPGIAPVINANERNRSNSESVIQASAAARQKRMGIVRRERTELDSIDETKVVRQSHARGFSYGSALRRNGSISSPGAASSSPSSPKETRKDKTQFVKRLSSLPEHKSERTRRPLIEGAKGILYALYQVHPHISGLILASKGRDPRRSGLEMSFYNASVHVDKLNKSLEDADNHDPEDEDAWDRIEEAVNNDCATCIKSFVHVTTQMQESTRKIVASADPRYVRSLMLLLYGSVVEINNAIANFGVEVKQHRRQMSSGTTNPIATIPEESVTPERPQSKLSMDRDLDSMTVRQPTRLRSDTVLKHQTPSERILQPVQPPALQISTLPSNSNGSTITGSYSRSNSALGQISHKSFAARSRSNSKSTIATMNSDMQSSTFASTPRSNDSYSLPPMVSLNGHLNPDTGLTDAEEELRFEQIFLALSKAYETALQAVPITTQQLQRCLETAIEERRPKEVQDVWSGLVQKSKTCFDLTQALQIRLSNMKLKDSGVGLSSAEGGRHDPSFWMLCKSFLQSFIVLVTEMKEARKLQVFTLPQEIAGVLRPVQKACRDAGQAVSTSPWNFLFQGANLMPAPTPFAQTGGEAARQQFNRHGNSSNGNGNVFGYSSAMAQQQNLQAQNGIYPSVQQRGQLQSPPVLSSLSTPNLPMPSASTGTSPMSATSPLAATPLSAALGPAAQATIPSTPATLHKDSFFKGDVFQRADSLLSMPQAPGANFITRR